LVLQALTRWLAVWRGLAPVRSDELNS
jgi:hypothetical protein